MSCREDDTQLSTVERFAALSRVGTALMKELDEKRLLHLIAVTACELTGASFAAFSVRPTDESGQLLVPSEGNLFHLAAVVGVTKEQEALFRRMPLGGEGLLAPIFRHGVSVLVPDVFTHLPHTPEISKQASRDMAREAAFAFAHGQIASGELRSMGLPRGHPIMRSFLGAPLLDSDKQVRGGLLLGHTEPDRFTPEDEVLLGGLAAQAAIALENARLYRTAQVRAQELNAIFESITDGVMLLDRQGKLLRENGTARHLREHLQGHPESKRIWEVIPQRAALAALGDGGVEDITVSLDDERGETKEYLVTASPLRYPTSSSGPLLAGEEETRTDSTVSGAVVVWHDVTERRLREAERVARNRLALLQLILDELPSSVYLVRGQDAHLVLANRAAKSVWGVEWPQGQPFATFLEEHGIRIFGIDGRELESSQLATVRALHHGEAVHQHQESIRHSDGTSVPVLVNAVALNIQELYASPSDVTKHIAERSEAAAIVVHQDVTALKEAERLKDEFIGLAAHELRTPLAILKGFAQTLLVQTARGKGPELAEWQKEALQGIDQATARMVELTEDLLDVTRLQAGRLELHLAPMDLVPLVQRLVMRMQMLTEKHLLSVQSTSLHLLVYGDSRRLEQVLNNLLGNAIKYSPDGGMIQVGMRQELETNTVLLSIHDHGIGIPAQQQAHLFGRFVRAENAQTHGIGGTGLGLYLCRELVERHGGRIWFESQEGEGSTFFVSLPLLSDED